MRFKKSPQLPGAGRTRAGHHHGSHTPTSPEAILLGKMTHHTKHIRRECIPTNQYSQCDQIPLYLGNIKCFKYRKIIILFIGMCTWA